MLSQKINKKGSIGKAMAVALGVLAVAVLAPVIFGSDGLANTNLTTDAPTWFVTIATLVAGFALVRVMVSKK